MKRYPEILIDIPADILMYSLEGIDGSGKSTAGRLTQAKLKAMGVNCVNVGSPSGDSLGTFLRSNLKDLEPWRRHTLFVMDMAGTILREYSKDKNTVLLWDRYIDSNIVSNRDTSPEESAKWIACLPLPRKTFFLDIDPQTILEKRVESVHDHSADLGWQRLKYERYQELAIRNPGRIITINALETKETISDFMVKVIIEDLKVLRRGSDQK